MGGMHGNIDLGVAEIKDNNFKAEGLVKGMGKVRQSNVIGVNVITWFSEKMMTFGESISSLLSNPII